MTELPSNQNRLSGLRAAAAVLIGLTGAVAIWIAAPRSDYIIGNSFICDNYLPVAAVFVVLVLVLAVNPVLSRLCPALRLNSRQLALAFGIMLVACCLPGTGLMRTLPYSLAKAPLEVSADRELAEAYGKLNLPRSLFPVELGYDKAQPVSENFVGELPPGESTPWGAWVGPLLSWGTFLVFAWLMTIGLAQIVLPQWQDNERLPFPLLTVEQSLIEVPEGKGALPPLFRRPGFWLAAGTVFGLHFLLGLRNYYPDRVPAIPLSWNLRGVFTTGLFQYAPYYLSYGRIYFVFVGVAFFMPGRIGCSIWMFQILYAFYAMFGAAYFPPFEGSTITDHRMGAMLSVAAAVLYLGRAHWARVIASVFRRARTPEDRRNRQAAIMFFPGCAGMTCWLMWAGVSLPWALFLVAFAFVVSLVISRVVAETGLVFIRMHFDYAISLVKFVPLAWISMPALFFARVIAILFSIGSRVSTTVMGMHAMALDQKASPQSRTRTALILLPVLVIGLVIAGGSNLTAAYHHSTAINGWPINEWGSNRLGPAHADIVEHSRGTLSRPAYNQVGHTIFGAGLAGFLELMCLRSPTWPLHPIGLLMVNTFHANEAWISVFLGWFAKVLILRYGGARLYRPAQAVFLGLIIGEVFAAAFWAAEPAVRVLFGLPYRVIQIQPY